MNCPKDGHPLESQRYDGGVTIDTCPTCAGVWLDKGELEAVMASDEHQHTRELARTEDTYGQAIGLAKDGAAPLVACPSCDRQMERREYGMTSQILVDTCPSGCGRWLDKGELDALEVFYERLRAEDAADEARENSGFWASLAGFFKGL